MSDLIRQKIALMQFRALPESSPRHEFIDGERITRPTPTENHQGITGKRYLHLTHPELGGRERVAPLDRDVQPDRIIEILSPSNRRYDRKVSFGLYERHGVAKYRIVGLAEPALEVWALQSGRYRGVGHFEPGETFAAPVPGKPVDVRLALA